MKVRNFYFNLMVAYFDGMIIHSIMTFAHKVNAAGDDLTGWREDFNLRVSHFGLALNVKCGLLRNGYFFQTLTRQVDPGSVNYRALKRTPWDIFPIEF